PWRRVSPVSLYFHSTEPVSLSVAMTSSPIVLTFRSARWTTREPWKPCIDDTLLTPTLSIAAWGAAAAGAPPLNPLCASCAFDDGASGDASCAFLSMWSAGFSAPCHLVCGSL